jgi:hypothetical protein
MSHRFKFDVGEIEFVADNMDCHTRDYVVAARRAAMRRARMKGWSEHARERMRRASEKMGAALREWPAGRFDMRIGTPTDGE